jgi:hypothetical protein
MTLTWIRHVLRRRTLLDDARAAAAVGFDAGDETDRLVANAKEIGLDRVSPTRRLLFDGMLRGLHWYESANYRLPVQYRWLTWPLVALVTLIVTGMSVAKAGPQGVWVLLVFPLWVLAMATAGVVYTVGEHWTTPGLLGRIGLAGVAGLVGGAIFPAPLFTLLSSRRPAVGFIFAIGLTGVAGVALQVMDWAVTRSVRRTIHGDRAT